MLPTQCIIKNQKKTKQINKTEMWDRTQKFYLIFGKYYKFQYRVWQKEDEERIMGRWKKQVLAPK